GMVALWDEQDGLLLPKAADGYTDNRLIREIKCRAGEALPGRVFASGEPLVVDELDFAKKYKLPSESLMLYREATGGRLPVSSMVIPLQTAGDPLGVIVLDNFNTTSAFTPEDVALITSLAQQTALSLENARLFQAADERAAQLRSLTEVSATVTSSLQTDDLIATLLDQFATLVPFDTGTLWLRMGNQLTIRAARGFDETEGRIGLTANVEDSQLLHEMVTAGQPISVENTHADARFPALVEHPYLSWLGIPLISKGEVVGVIALEKLERAFYNQEHIQIARTFAAQATVALENARLFEESLRRTVELDERSRRLDRLNLTSTELSKSLDPDYIMVFTISELQQALGADGVAAVLFDEQGNPVLQAENPSRGEKLPKVLPDLAVFSRLKETLGVFTTAEVTKEADLKPLEDFLSQRKARSLALIPMATGSELHGLVMVYAEKNARFPAGEVELATTITNQAAIAFQNARQYEETRQFSFELEKRVAERTRELENEHRRTEILLKIITELSASLDLDIIINRTLELINEITGAEQSTVLLVQPEEANFIFRASQGFTTPPPGGGEETWLKVDEGLAGWVIKNQQGVLIPDLSEDARWLKKTDQVTEHRSAIAVPLVAGAESLGTLMIFHREPGRFSIDLLDLVKAIAQQIAVSINNAQLYLLIRDQAERLGGMLRSQQVETTRSRAILESVAEGILVTDSKGVITLFNQAGEEILGLEQRLIMDQALDEFSGLFGRAAYSWMETIRYWSTDPASAQSSEAFDQEIQLEDGRVVAVSLSPVILRDEFLGTVSIFHDITHQVEVDRLKSEFVATVSHELRTPMTSIKGYVEVLLMGAAGELSEKQQKFLEIVRVNTERLNILVDDLLDISRIEAGKVNLSLQPLDVREIAERSIDIVRQRSKDEDKPIAIDFQPQDNLPRIMGDPGRISQIVSNLVDN
ncbi:MAG: GAF domain-containing protein, partial [Anaerolineales bacterium]|nr:GAF domain-containing protein [Anaerolineales bacterium]